MQQNTSHAVMAQRHEAHDSLDHFPTPPWATRALCEWLKPRFDLHAMTCWEPACAEGYMAMPLAEYFSQVDASDIHNYGFGTMQYFLHDQPTNLVHWTITNPPFNLAAKFAIQALQASRIGCAMLTRIAFIESADRYYGLFSRCPPSHMLQFVERVPMQKGILNRFGSTATAYCWLVWLKHEESRTAFHWLAPCRKYLERDSDYPPLPAQISSPITTNDIDF